MTDRRVARLALDPQLASNVFPDDVRQRLSRLVEIDGLAARSAVDDHGSGLAKVEILLTGWGCPRLDANVLDQAPRLRAVFHAGGTVKQHLDPAVFARGITVSSAAAANAVPVADYTMAMLILSAKQAFTRSRAYAEGTETPQYTVGEDMGLAGSTVGIVGASRIGRLVINRLRTHEARILVADPNLNAPTAETLGVTQVDPDELCRRSDIVSMHAPALPETRHLLDARRLSMLRDGAVVINTARGTIVETDALTAECKSGRLGAILDVTHPEPLPAEHPLHHLPNVVVTPHLAGARGREVRWLGEFAVDEVERFVHGKPLLGLVREADLAHVA